MKTTPQLHTNVQASLPHLTGSGIAVHPSLFAMVLGIAVLASGLIGRTALGQNVSASPAATTPQASGLQRHPLDIEGTQPDPHEEYLLGGGDDITVSVAGRPELSGAHVVGPDGRITMPVIGSVVVGEKSRDDAAKSIDGAVENFYTGKSSTTVQVTKYGSNHITLDGAIANPGVITFDQPPTLLDAIARGGLVLNADHTTQMPRKCVIYRGEDQVMNVNLSDRFDGKRALSNIRLRRNDYIFFPENQESLISVIGEVVKQGPVRLNSNSTLVGLLADAGGITEKAGNPTIQIVEPSTGRIQTIKYKELLTLHGGTDIGLHDGDIIYVPRSGIARTGYIFSQLSGITNLGTLVALQH